MARPRNAIECPSLVGFEQSQFLPKWISTKTEEPSSMRPTQQVYAHALVAFALLAAGLVNPVLTQGATWTQISTATSPAARSYPAMAYDSVSKKIILFGGGGANANLND